MKGRTENGSDGVVERWSDAKAKQVNTEHPTSNIQHPMPEAVRSGFSFDVGCWLLVVGCSFVPSA
jgi:hypothetical protein